MVILLSGTNRTKNRRLFLLMVLLMSADKADPTEVKSIKAVNAKAACGMGLFLLLAGVFSSAAAFSGLRMYDSVSAWTSTASGMRHSSEMALAVFSAATLMILIALISSLSTGIKAGRTPLLTLSFWLTVFLAVCVGSNYKTVLAAKTIMGFSVKEFTWESMESLYEFARLAYVNRTILLVLFAAGAIAALYGLIRLINGTLIERRR